MTANFGCRERRTMASQPSVHNEDRNLLRLRAWEQRIQETSQAKELNPENVPLFGEPYKTNRGDELSNRIQRMLGSYEDVNHPSPLTTEPSPIPTYAAFSQSDQGQTKVDKSTKASFHNQVHRPSTQTQKCSSGSGYSSQPVRTSSASSSPNQHGHSSAFMSKPSLNQPGHSAHQHQVNIKSEAFSDLRERVSLPQEMSAQSPDVKPLPFLHSSSRDNTDTDTKDAFDKHQLQESSDHPCESMSTIDVSTLSIKQSPKDVSLSQTTKTNALPSQTFPPLLSSKQPSVVMTQKPTAYVRPMDGQDQVVSESPELKPSPEPYAPLPELISKSNPGKMKILPPFLETRTNEAQCVEDILREMTPSWPPLLPAINTPGTNEAPKSPFSSKETERVSSCSGQKNYDSCPPPPPPPPPSSTPSQLNQQSSTSSFEAAHSSGVESASSSDSESSSRSESDSESATEEPPGPPASSSVKTEPDAPAVSHGDWQLGNWIRSNQQNSSTESQSGPHASRSPVQKQPPAAQSSKQPGVEVVDSSRESKPSQLSSRQKELNTNVPNKPQQSRERNQDNRYQQSSQKSSPPSADVRKRSCNAHSSKPAKEGGSDRREATVSVKCEEVVATRDKDPCFTDRPKVKTKTRHYKNKNNDGGDAKEISKRTKHMSLDKRKLGSESDVKLLQCHCSTCGVRYPNSCCCATQSPAQPHQSPAATVKTSSSKPTKVETTLQPSSEKPHKTTPKPSEETGRNKSSRGHRRRPRSLLVKIDLSLLSRVPVTSDNHQETLNNAKRSVLVVEQNGGGREAAATNKHNKTSKKNKHPTHVEVDNKTLPRKKQRLENKNTSSAQVSNKLENSTEDREKKKTKKNPVALQQPPEPKDSTKDSKLLKRRVNPAETQESNKESVKSKDSSKHKKRKYTEQPRSERQKLPKSSSDTVPSTSQPNKVLINRPLLRCEDRRYPVKHYIKEAKKLKHKADAESDKLSKVFNYLDAAMFFVESGIAMEKDSQISMSSYTMFSDTVELLKFVLKLKHSVDPPAPPSENDFLSLCLKCQALLQMTMFRHKHKTALEYSKTLTEHFANSAQASHDPSVCTPKVAGTPSPMPNMPSPATASTGSVTVPHAIEQVAFTYINITTLFLSAHDLWDQAVELAQRGSGLLTELDAAMGPLSLTSTMSSMVRYTRQGLHWLRLDTQKVK